MGIFLDYPKAKAASGKGFIFTNFRSGTPAHRQVTSLENCRFRGEGGGIIYRETALKVSVISTIRGTFNWLCCSLNKDGGGGRRLCY